MTLRVNYAEDGPKDGSSPRLTANGYAPGGSVSRRIRVTDWNDTAQRSDAELAMRQAVGWSVVASLSGSTVLSRELPEVYPQAIDTSLTNALYSCAYLCRTASIVKRETWNGRTVYLEPGAPDTTAGRPVFTIDTSASGRQRTKGGPDELDPVDALPKVNRYKHSVLELTYEPSDMFLLADATIWGTYGGSELYRMCTFRYDRTVKYFALAGKSMYYVGSDATGHTAAERLVNFGVGILEAQKTIYVKQFAVDVTAVPWITIENTEGHVSSDTFNTPSNTYPPGTLLYMPPRTEYYMMANGRLGCNVEHVMLYFKRLHNKILRVQGDNRNYQYITADSTIATDPTPGSLPAGKFLYDEAAFAKVFKPSSDDGLFTREVGPPRDGEPLRLGVTGGGWSNRLELPRGVMDR